MYSKFAASSKQIARFLTLKFSRNVYVLGNNSNITDIFFGVI